MPADWEKLVRLHVFPAPVTDIGEYHTGPEDRVFLTRMSTIGDGERIYINWENTTPFIMMIDQVLAGISNGGAIELLVWGVFQAETRDLFRGRKNGMIDLRFNPARTMFTGDRIYTELWNRSGAIGTVTLFINGHAI